MSAKEDTYAERLSAALQAKGVSKTALARHLKISPQALSHVFTGHTRSLTAANNARAAALLGVDSAW
jgi:transcriptional regulator with XRE-family HTH domain